MRYMPQILRQFFKPVLPPPAVEREPLDAAIDQATHALDAAVLEHEQTATRLRETRERNLQATLDELLERIGQHP